MPGLSLCMIVRDEAELLPEFLRRARGLWDELRVVDTGSRDASPRLLAEAGATVLHAPWSGDFAEARNRSLEGATGEWIAVLDADEMVSEAFVRDARGLVGDPSAGAATLRMLNRMPHGHVREARLLRLFRNDPSIRFRHAIHEDASEAVSAHLAATGRRLVHLEGPVDHLGYVRARAAAKDKKARDVALLERCLAADPRDLYAHLKLLEQARFWGDQELWGRAAARARDAVDAAGAGLAAVPHGGELLVLVVDGLGLAPAAALAWLDAREARAAPSAALRLRRGELLERLGRLPEAAAAFEGARALDAVTANLQLATVRPLLGLARLAIARGQLDEARGRVDEALGLAPRDPEALLAAVTLAGAAGGGAGMRALAAAHAARHGESEELAAAVGEGALRLGDRALAIEVLSRGAPTRLLAVARLADGDLEGARAAAGAAAGDDPAAALAAVLADLAGGRDAALELELSVEEAAAALRGMAALLRAAARPGVREALRAAAPALAGPFPWLPGAL
ncbi:MAG: glycosyltransferase [Anaeromyxobacteraceae bacterium]